MKRTAGGAFDPSEPPMFFMAGARAINDVGVPVEEFYRWLLMPVNELSRPSMVDLLVVWCEKGAEVFLDSGIYPLAADHARKHGLPFDKARSLPPQEVDGFDDLLALYMDNCRTFGKRLWGYCELDQGSTDDKRAMRRYLESEGLKPMPVYHPIYDGWDYLDELMDEYDRICVGNVGWADATMRDEILITVWERRRRLRRKVWIHALGYTPNNLFATAPLNSADSTTHIYALQYGSKQNIARSMLGHFSIIDDPDFSGDIRSEVRTDEELRLGRGDAKAAALAAYIAHMDDRAWRQLLTDEARVFGDPLYPPLARGERASVGPRAS